MQFEMKVKIKEEQLLEGMRKGALLTAESLALDAKDHVPIWTGELRDSIRAETVDANTYRVIADAPAEDRGLSYAEPIEKGSRELHFVPFYAEGHLTLLGQWAMQKEGAEATGDFEHLIWKGKSITGLNVNKAHPFMEPAFLLAMIRNQPEQMLKIGIEQALR